MPDDMLLACEMHLLNVLQPMHKFITIYAFVTLLLYARENYLAGWYTATGILVF